MEIKFCVEKFYRSEVLYRVQVYLILKLYYEIKLCSFTEYLNFTLNLQQFIICLYFIHCKVKQTLFINLNILSLEYDINVVISIILR